MVSFQTIDLIVAQMHCDQIMETIVAAIRVIPSEHGQH